MSTDIKITAEIDGKKVPLNTISDETFTEIKALEKSKEVPVTRTATIDGDRRLILRVTEEMVKCKGRYIAIDPTSGQVCNDWSVNNEQDKRYGCDYKNIESL